MHGQPRSGSPWPGSSEPGQVGVPQCICAGDHQPGRVRRV